MENFNTPFLKGILSNLPTARQSATAGSSHKPICDFVPVTDTGQKVTKMWSSLNITHLHQHPRGVRTRQNRKQQQKSLKLTIFPSMTLEKKPSQIPWSSISDHFLAYHWHSKKLKRNTGTKSNKPSPSSAPSPFCSLTPSVNQNVTSPEECIWGWKERIHLLWMETWQGSSTNSRSDSI